MLDKFCFGILVIFETDKKTAGAETQILDVLTNFFNMIHSSLYTKGRGRESTPAIPDLFNFLSLSLPSALREANARNVGLRNIYGGQSTLSTQLIKSNYHINCGVIQGFPALRKAVTTHVKKYRIFSRVLI